MTVADREATREGLPSGRPSRVCPRLPATAALLFSSRAAPAPQSTSVPAWSARPQISNRAACIAFSRAFGGMPQCCSDLPVRPLLRKKHDSCYTLLGHRFADVSLHRTRSRKRCQRLFPSRLLTFIESKFRLPPRSRSLPRRPSGARKFATCVAAARDAYEKCARHVPEGGSGVITPLTAY